MKIQFTRLELAFSHPMEEYPIFEELEADANRLYGFFHVSDKRYALLDEYVKGLNEATFRLSKIFKVR